MKARKFSYRMKFRSKNVSLTKATSMVEAYFRWINGPTYTDETGRCFYDAYRYGVLYESDQI